MDMDESKRGEETFLAKLCTSWRFTVHEPVRDILGLKEGDKLMVTIRKETFLANLHKGWRVTIYEPVRGRLGLKEGDYLRVTIRKEEA